LALVLVGLAALGNNILVEDHRGQVALRPLPERLMRLRGVDANQTNLVLVIGAIKEDYRITIGDTDYAASEIGGMDSEGEEQCKQEAHEPASCKDYDPRIAYFLT